MAAFARLVDQQAHLQNSQLILPLLCSFVVWKQGEFADKLLPRHFKHSNFSSFVRQVRDSAPLLGYTAWALRIQKLRSLSCSFPLLLRA